MNTDIVKINIEEEGRSIFSPSSYDAVATVDNTILWKKIVDSLRNVLTSTFSNDSKRNIISHEDRIQFACVYCGDSVRDDRKKRGNLFPDTMMYHCFNGDCTARMSIFNFLKDKNQLDNFTQAEINYLKESSSSRILDLKKIKAALGLETYFSDEIVNLSVERGFLMTKLKLQEIKGSKIENYLVDRLQFNFNNFAYDPNEKVLHVFNLTADSEHVIGMQVKTFNKKNSYLTYKLSNIHEMLGIFEDKNREILQKMDHLSNIFGIFRVDLNKPVTVLEGPLDSFLFPNAIALCSAKNSLPFDLDNVRYFFDADETGKNYAIKYITMGKPVFLWRKFFEDNELSEFSHKIKDLNDLLIFMKTHPKKYTKFVDNFSDNKYDIIFI